MCRYQILSDTNGDPRVIIATESKMEIAAGQYYAITYYGIAIRGDQDDNDFTVGKRIAEARLVRAMKNRKPCYVRSDNAIRNIWQLDFKDFQKLMFFTGNKVSGFPKSGVYGFTPNIKEKILKYQVVEFLLCERDPRDFKGLPVLAN